jgi:hypothetical protein
MALRSLSKGVTRLASSSGRSAPLCAARSFSVLAPKERGDEARYFIKKDQELQEKMRLRLDEILSSDSAEKQEVINLLGM